MSNVLQKQSSGLQSKNVILSNALIRSAQGLNLVEKRILMAAIGKMGGIMQPIVITAQEYADTFDVPVRQGYWQLREAEESLMSKRITYYGEYDGHLGTHKIHWLSRSFYTKNEGFIVIQFNHDLMPELCDLQQHFTQYQLKQATSLRSVHSWRLMELFEQMKNAKDKDGWLTISIEEFHHAMDASDSYKANFNLLKTRCIAPAVKELQEKDNWLIDWVAVKTGRKVSHLKFTFQHGGKSKKARKALPK